MKITVTQNKLSKALNNVSRVAVGKVTLPILNNVLIRVDSKKVSLVTTNLDMAVVDYLPVSSSEDGVITVPARLLAEFINNLPRGENITIESEGTKVTISAGQYSSTINGSLADDFPELPEINEKSAVTYKMTIDEFKTGITSVIISPVFTSTLKTTPSLSPPPTATASPRKNSSKMSKARSKPSFLPLPSKRSCAPPPTKWTPSKSLFPKI